MPPHALLPPAPGNNVFTIRRLAALAAAAIILGLGNGSARAQLAVDNTSFSTIDAAELMYPHTITSGADALLMVGVEVHAHTTVNSVEWGSASSPCSSACDPATCLCGLTQVGTVSDSNKAVTVQLWKLVNPPAGSGNVRITLPSNHRMVSGATSFVGVDPSTPLGTAASGSGETGTPASVDVSSLPGAIVLDAVGTTSDTSLAVGEGQTRQYLGAVSATSGATEGITGAGSTADGAGSVTMSWSLSAASWAIIGVSINPAPTPTAPPPSPTASATPTLPVPTCIGDCDGSGTVTVDEIITMVNIDLGVAPLTACPAGDADGSGDITVDEIIAAVNNDLTNCPA